MALSLEYKALRKRLTELKTHMLPASFSATGDYTERQRDRIRGYRVLAHAEIEDYLETVARKAAVYVRDQWVKNKTMSPTLFAMLVHYKHNWALLEDGAAPQDGSGDARYGINDKVTTIVYKAVREYTEKLDHNNGIKEENLKKMFHPLDIHTSELDSSWIAKMNTFGAGRGELAHTTGVRVTIDPRAEYEDVHITILGGLKELDLKVQAILGK